MGWISSSEWRCSKDAVDYASQCGVNWEIVWRGGNSAIYIDKRSGRPAHSHFLISRLNGEIAVKDISDFRSVSAARKFLSIAMDYISKNPSGESDIKYYIDSARELVANEDKKKLLKNLKVGDVVYIKEQYVHSGEVIYRGRSKWNKHSHLVDMAGAGCLIRVQSKHFDLDKMFSNKK